MLQSSASGDAIGTGNGVSGDDWLCSRQGRDDCPVCAGAERPPGSQCRGRRFWSHHRRAAAEGCRHGQGRLFARYGPCAQAFISIASFRRAGEGARSRGRLIFATVPRAPRRGSCASITRSSRRFSRRKTGTRGKHRGNEPLTSERPTCVRSPVPDAGILPRPSTGRLALRCVAAALVCCMLAGSPADAVVGGAPLADQAIARHVVLIVGGRALCTGVAIAPDLVLTAAHCVLSNGKYRLVSFEGRRSAVKDVISVAPHPQFSPSPNSPDLALVKLATHPAPNLTPVPFSDRRVPPEVGDRFIVAGFGVGDTGRPQDRRQAAHGNACRNSPPELAATQPDRSAKAGRSRWSRRLQRRFGRSSVRCPGPRPGRHRELVGTHRWRTRMRIRERRRAARALPLLDH